MAASIVIPAHDEGPVIGRLLESLTTADLGLQIVVVCNGCGDDTAAVAGRFPTVTVIEIAESSKVAALNAGDQHAPAFPRLYLDADVRIDHQSLRLVLGALVAGADAVSPLPIVNTSGCSMLVQAYFAVWGRLGYATKSALGSGFYALSESGRSRFAGFPDLISDDGYVYTHFGVTERVNPPGATFTIAAPRSLRSLVRRRVRIVAGNMQLLTETGRHIEPPGPNWLDVVRRQPRLAAPAIVYVGVNLLGKLIAKRNAKHGRAIAWGQDRTSRAAAVRHDGPAG